MGKVSEFAERGWQRLWCVPQASRERARDTNWNRLELNAIGSMWGRDLDTGRGGPVLTSTDGRQPSSPNSRVERAQGWQHFIGE